ncbi:hypothetical protein PO909_020249 [Leuciscus waleckii]
MVLLILLIFTLLLKVQPQRLSDQVWLTASPASVQKDSNTALRYDRPTDADHSHYNTVLNQKEKPVITVIHDNLNGEFRIYCHIPGSDNAGYACFTYIGDENRLILKSHKPYGRTQCISTLREIFLFNQLKSVKSKVMSCSYSPEPASSKHSPYSDTFNLTVFLPVQIQSPSRTKASTIYSTPTFSTSETTTKTLATEYTTWYETTINPTPGSWLLVVLVFTGIGLFLSGFMGFICLYLSASSDDVLTEVNYSSCHVETTSLLTSSVCSAKHG